MSSLIAHRVIAIFGWLATAAILAAQAAVPLMQPISDLETTVTFPRHDHPDRMHVYASNSPTSFAVTGLPPGANFFFETFNGVPSGVIYWGHSSLSGGIHTVSVTATNAAGTSSPVTFRWIVHPGMRNFISPDHRTYTVGDTITFTATFSAPVVVTGTPYLQLWGAKKAMYVSGSGTAELKFRYAIVADDPPVRDFEVTDIAPGDGTIATVDGVAASLHNTYRGLGDVPTLSVYGPSPTGSSRLVNLSSRGEVSSSGGGAFIAGFVVGGTTSKRYLLRAVGPSLGPLGVQNPLANPKLLVFDRDGRLFAENDDWSGSEVAAAFGQVGAFTLPAGSRDAALLMTLPPGPYTFHVLGNNGSGVALAEVYDASGVTAADDPPLMNISSRGFVGAGEAAIIVGFVVAGDSSRRFLIRAVGPRLADYGVPDVLADPVLTIMHDGVPLGGNDNWEGGTIAATAAAVGAFPLHSGSKDAATIVTLPPGVFTAVMTGRAGSTGSGLLEVYLLPNEP